MKSKSKSFSLFGLIMKILTIVASVMTFVSMSFDFLVTKSGSLSKSISMKDWTDALDEANKTNLDLEYVKFWNAARVFLIITLVLVAIVAVLCVLKFFIKNKFVDLALVITSALAVVTVIVFLVLLCVGCGKVSSSYAKFTASAGPICITIFGLVAGVTGALNGLKLKK